MTTATATRPHFFTFWVLPIALAAAIPILLVEMIRIAPTAAARLACDRAFASMMSATTTVDLDRSKFLLAEMNCSVGHRYERLP